MAEGSSPVLMHDARPTGSAHSPPSDGAPGVPACSPVPCPSRHPTAGRARPLVGASVKRGGPGGPSGVAPPVPFPNTVVKRPSAYDTGPATAWDNRSVPGPPLDLFFFNLL